jgi:hypothetical protein
MLKQFLAGEFSLFKTYWLITVPSFIALGVIAKLIGLEPATAPTVLWVICFLITIALTTIGIWNSSSNYNGNSFWKWTVKAQCFLTVIPFILAILTYLLQGLNLENPNRINDLLNRHDTNCLANINCSKGDSQPLVPTAENNRKNNLINQLKYCELLYDSETKKFSHALKPSIKIDKEHTSTHFIYKGKEDEISSWYPLLQKADSDGRVEEARNIANLIRANSITVYYKKDFSKEFITKLYAKANANEICEARRRDSLSEYSKSDLISLISKEERLDIFNNYIRNDSAYISANPATQQAIKLRYKIDN